MSTAASARETDAPAPRDQGASVGRKVLLIAEAGVMFAVFWATRPLERISPRSTIWVDRWMGRVAQQIELVVGIPGSDLSTKEGHGKG